MPGQSKELRLYESFFFLLKFAPQQQNLLFKCILSLNILMQTHLVVIDALLMTNNTFIPTMFIIIAGIMIIITSKVALILNEIDPMKRSPYSSRSSGLSSHPSANMKKLPLPLHHSESAESSFSTFRKRLSGCKPNITMSFKM